MSVCNIGNLAQITSFGYVLEWKDLLACHLIGSRCLSYVVHYEFVDHDYTDHMVTLLYLWPFDNALNI